MTRVLHVVGDSRFGGGSVVILQLARMAGSLGWQVDVLTTDPVFRQVLGDHGINTVDWDVVWRPIRPWRDYRGARRLRSLLQANRYDLVHTHTSKAGFVGRMAAKGAGVPAIVHTVHGFAFHEESGRLAVSAGALLERRAARWCDRIVTVSRFHREWALRLGIGGPEQLVAIPNGISTRRLTPTRGRDALRASLGLSEDTVAILTTGRLAAQKGLEHLIAAVPQVVSSARGPVRFILAGDGPLKTTLLELARGLGVEAHVSFAGFRQDVGDLLEAADLVALPSIREGLSIALLEAMAVGKPIVATTIGSNREVAGPSQAAWLVPPKNPGALASAIVGLVEDPDRARALGLAARSTFLASYTEAHMIGAYREVYRSLARCKGLPIGPG